MTISAANCMTALALKALALPLKALALKALALKALKALKALRALALSLVALAPMQASVLLAQGAPGALAGGSSAAAGARSSADLSDADGRSVSYSVWSLNGERITLRFLLPVSETQRITGTDIAVLRTTRFGDYLLDHVAVRAAGQPCPAIDQGYDIGRVDPLTVGPGLDGFEIFFQCTQTQDLQFVNHALFGQLPAQVNFARVQLHGGPYSEQLFTAANQVLRVPGTGRFASAGLGRYFALGARHILESLDRLCFLLAGLLLASRARDVGALIGGLALGYALSLPAALGLPITPRATLLDAFIGFLVALLALQLMMRHVLHVRRAAVIAALVLLGLAALSRPLQASGSVLMLVGAALFTAGAVPLASALPRAALLGALAALFGLLDGFILPSALLPLQLPALVRLPMLVGFNAGAFTAQSALLLAGLAAAALWSMARRRPRRELRALATDAAAAALGGLGVFWMITRL